MTHTAGCGTGTLASMGTASKSESVVEEEKWKSEGKEMIMIKGTEIKTMKEAELGIEIGTGETERDQGSEIEIRTKSVTDTSEKEGKFSQGVETVQDTMTEIMEGTKVETLKKTGIGEKGVRGRKREKNFYLKLQSEKHVQNDIWKKNIHFPKM
uniref:Uncharacterized protein n=1 Tax=Anguilla anguilla TaxID=7936 RepID=A0A0E9WEJ4_ANGAN